MANYDTADFDLAKRRLFFHLRLGGSSLAAVTFAGVLPLRSPDLLTQILIATSFGLAWALIQFRGNGIRGVTMTVLLPLVVSPALAVSLLSLALGRTSGMGLVGLAASIALIGVGMLFMGRSATFDDSDIDARTYFSVIGSTILGGFVGAALFFTIDAGLKLLMA